MRFFKFLIFSFVFFSLCVSALHAEVEISYNQHKNIVYSETDGVGLILDVFVPKGDQNGYGIVDVASGAWHSDRSKIRDHKKAQMYQLMCERGFVVFAVRPGSITKFKGEEMLNNLRKGIVWVKERADDYHIKADKLGIVGASAGGHLASLAALTADEKTSVAAVAVFFPPTDLVNFLPAGDSNPIRYERVKLMTQMLAMGTLTSSKSDAALLKPALKSLSPVYHVTKEAPPFLLIHGDADELVPLEQSKKLQKRLQQENVPVKLIIKPGGGHPWPTIHEEVAVLTDWLVQQLVIGEER